MDTKQANHKKPENSKRLDRSNDPPYQKIRIRDP